MWVSIFQANVWDNSYSVENKKKKVHYVIENNVWY